jgi:hypothetical protein
MVATLATFADTSPSGRDYDIHTLGLYFKGVASGEGAEYQLVDADYIDALTIPETVNDGLVTSISKNAFADRIDIEAVRITQNIKEIGANAFSGCTELTNLEFDSNANTVTIGEAAFKNTSISTVKLPNSTVIGKEAFRSCTKLQKVTIQSDVLTGAQYAFADCSELTSIELPSNATKIPQNFAYKCSKLGNLIIPENVTCLGQSCLEGCSSIQSVALPESVLVIESYVFKDCSSLSELKLNNSVRDIYGAIIENTQIKDVVLPNSVVKLQNTFKNSNIETVSIPSSVTTIINGFSYLFANCTKLNRVYLPSFDWLTNMNLALNIAGDGTGVDIYFDGELFTELVVPGRTSIFDGEYKYCRSLKKVTLENSVTAATIGIQAFANCESLEEVNIGAGQTTIAGKSAFSGCKNLTTFTISSKNKGFIDIPVSTFEGCTSLKTIQLDNCETIGHSAFKNSGLETISLDKMTTVGNSAFYYATNLISASIPNATALDDDAFSDCSSLEELNLGTLNSIGARSLSGLTSLKELKLKCENLTLSKYSFCVDYTKSAIEKITFDGSVSYIGADAFPPSLTEVEFKGKVGTIDGKAFEYCQSSMKRLYLDDVVDWIGADINGSIFKDYYDYTPHAEYYVNGELITDLVIPAGASVANYAFEHCTSIKSVTFEQGEEPLNYTIGKYAFHNTPLQSITLAEGLSDIGSWAFVNTHLDNLVLPNSLESVVDIVSNCPHVTLSPNIKEYDSSSLMNNKLTGLIFPYGAESIDDFNFANSSYGIRHYSFPETLNKLYNISFSCYYSDCNLYSWRSTPPETTGYIKADSGENNLIVHVPIGCKDAYESDAVWSNQDEKYPNIVVDDLDSEFVVNPYGTSLVIQLPKNDLPTFMSLAKIIVKLSTEGDDRTTDYEFIAEEDKEFTEVTINDLEPLNSYSLDILAYANDGSLLLRSTKEADITTTLIRDAYISNVTIKNRHINVGVGNVGKTLKIYTIDGSTVMTTNIDTDNQSISIEHLNNGYYILSLGEQTIKFSI